MPHVVSKEQQTVKIELSKLIDFRSRKLYTKLEELAEGLKKQGQIEPAIVRRKPGKKELYEVVAGTRRRRAAAIAGWDALDCIVRNLTDEQAIEIHIAENRDREDVHPLDEALALQDLHEQHGVSVGEMAARMGRSEDYILGRLKLALLPEEIQTPFLAGRFGIKGALVLAGIADTMQVRVWTELSKLPDANLSAAKIAGFIRDRFLLRLSHAPFPIDQEDLVEGAKPCKKCPKRTGVQSSLFPEDIAIDDRCTDLDCFTKKKQAWADSLVEKATKENLTVLEKAEAREVFKFGESIELLNPDAKYVACDGKVKLGGEGITYRELLKQNPPPISIAINPGGAGIELYEKQAVATAMRASKVPFVKEWESVCLPKQSSAKSADEKPNRKEAKQHREGVELAIKALVEEVENADDASATQRKKLFQLVALGAARNTWSQVQKSYIKAHGIDDSKTGGDTQARINTMLEDHISKLTVPQCIALVFELALRREVLGTNPPDENSPFFQRALTVAGLKLKTFHNRAKGLENEAAEKTGPKTQRSSEKPKVPAKRGRKAKGDKAGDENGPPASGYGGMCGICGCARVEPCEREIDGEKRTCTRAPGGECCSLCEEILIDVDMATDKSGEFDPDAIHRDLIGTAGIIEGDGDRDLIVACMSHLVEEGSLERLPSGKYRRVTS